MRATRTILAGALLEGRRIAVHPLAAKSVGLPILESSSPGVLSFCDIPLSIEPKGVLTLEKRNEVLFTYIKLLATLVQLEFLFFRHLDQSIRGLKKGRIWLTSRRSYRMC